jgi:hypothetical protein
MIAFFLLYVLLVLCICRKGKYSAPHRIEITMSGIYSKIDRHVKSQENNLECGDLINQSKTMQLLELAEGGH